MNYCQLWKGGFDWLIIWIISNQRINHHPDFSLLAVCVIILYASFCYVVAKKCHQRLVNSVARPADYFERLEIAEKLTNDLDKKLNTELNSFNKLLRL